MATSSAEDTALSGLSDGTYVFNLNASDGLLDTDDQITLTIAAAPSTGVYKILLVVGNSTLSTNDQLIYDQLDSNGHNVIVLDDGLATVSSATGFDLVYIAGSTPSTLSSTFKDVTVPVVSSQVWVSSSMKLGTSVANGIYARALNVVDPGHPIAAGNSGSTDILDSSKGHTYVVAYPSGTIVATQIDDPNKHEIVAYEIGDDLSTGFAAPARRVTWPWKSSTPQYVTATGWAMFDQAILWAADPSAIASNKPPTVVIVGGDQALAYGTTTTNLNATVTDVDGLPAPPALTYAWSWVTIPVGAPDPGFDTATAVDTGVTGLVEGTYVFKLTANDGELDGSNTVTVTVLGQNTAPLVSAGNDQTVANGTTTASLDATVSDDGLPAPPALTYIWVEESIPAAAATTMIDSFSTEDTSISGLSIAGAYVYKLTASDGDLSASSTVTIFVDPPAAAETPDMVIRKHYSLAGVAVATRTITDYPTDPDTDVLQWVVTDHLGSTTNVVDENLDPNTQNKTWYYPYGQTRGTTGSETGIDQGFTGQTNDPGTGLIHYNARQYDPVVGRFIQQDTIVPSMTLSADLNRYMYVRGNPVSYTDPSGHETCGTRDGKYVCWDDFELAQAQVIQSDGSGGNAEDAYSCPYAGCLPPPPGGPVPGPGIIASLGHPVLDVAGMVPVIGNFADGFNSAWYASEGDYLNAGLTAFAAIPILGLAAPFIKAKFFKAAAKIEFNSVDDVVAWIKKNLDSLTGKADDVAAGVAQCSRLRSFSAETRVLMGDGTSKPISEVEIGDWVMAEDPETGERDHGDHVLAGPWLMPAEGEARDSLRRWL